MRFGIESFAGFGAAVVLMSGGFAAAQTQPTPFRTVYPLHAHQANSAQLIVPAQVHPELAVPREVEAQPTYPWLAQVRYADSTEVYVDPAADLRKAGDRGIDENHSLVKAQRLYLDLHGVTSSDLAELSAASRATAPVSSGGANSALLMVPSRPLPAPITDADADAAPRTLPAAEPKRQPVPIPSVPRQTPPPQGQLADAS